MLSDMAAVFMDYMPVAQEVYLFAFFCLGFMLFRTERMQTYFRFLSAVPAAKKEFHVKARPCEHKAATMEDHCDDTYSMDLLCSDVRCGRYERAICRYVEVEESQRAGALRVLCDEAYEQLDLGSTQALLRGLAQLGDSARVGVLLAHLEGLCEGAALAELQAEIAEILIARKQLQAAAPLLRSALVASADVEVPAAVLTSAAQLATETSIAADDDADADAAAARAQVLEVLEILQLIEASHGLPSLEAPAVLLEWAVRQSPTDAALALRLEPLLRSAAGEAPLPAAVASALVRAFAGAAASEGGEDWSAKAIARFDELAAAAEESAAGVAGEALSEGQLVGLLSSCLETRNAAPAEHILRWAQRLGCCTDAVAAAAAKVTAESRPPQDASDGVARACAAVVAAAATSARAQKLDAQQYMGLIRACTRDGGVVKALGLLRELRDAGGADISAYNAALDVCVSAGDSPAARGLFQEMRASGRLDAVSFNILLKQHTATVEPKSGGASDAPRSPGTPPQRVGRSASGGSTVVADTDALLEEMRRCGIKPNTATYNSIISGALAEGDARRAWRTVDLMEQSVGVDAYTVSILFRGQRRGRSVQQDGAAFDRAIRLISKHAVKVDDILSNAVLEACVQLRDPQRFEEALRVLAARGWDVARPGAMHTCGMLIKAYGQSGQLNAAWRVWDEVTRERGLVASEQLYGQMIDTLVAGGRLDDALSLFEEMRAQYADRLSSQGFSVVYAMIIRGYAQRKDCARALQCYKEMRRDNVTAGLVLFNTLIDACSRVGDMDAAGEIFRDMVAADVVPDLITYSTLIKGHCFRADLDGAMGLFALMRERGIKPDAIVFNSLLDGCAKKQSPRLCEQVIHDMVEAGVMPGNHSASILIKLYGRCKDVDAAFRVFEEFPSKYGFRPNAAVFTCLMATCAASGRLDQAMELHDRMLQEGCNPDEKTYSTLLRGALRAGNLDACLRTVRAALARGPGAARNLLEEELAQSVLDLINRRKAWEKHGEDLLADLLAAGVRVRGRSAGGGGADRQQQQQQHQQHRQGRQQQSQQQQQRRRPARHQAQEH
eukprot:TRINITY_DN634_c3_g1_i1.p1 TRINITY_DN634_c3_g1~~TRINITY_DN634_c3_g1_i1.p1  ORF type:complete len:1069 (+),score=299.07 TRINITY_DN634_c3_g1_i1:92-3298(+)